MRARWRNRQRKRRAIAAVQISIARMTTAQTRMGNRILGRSSTIYGLLLLFLRINNIMLFFVCQVWNVTLKKTNEWRGNKEKPVEDLRTLNENYEKTRKATDKKYSYYDSFSMQITILRKLTSR